MYGTWKDKRDPQKHPVRYLALRWEEGLRKHPRVSGRAITGGKSWGQLSRLKATLGDLTPFVVDWISRTDNWWKFSQQVKVETKQYLVPADPDLGFIVKHRNRVLRIIRNELRNSTKIEDVQFCSIVDQQLMQQLKSLLLVYAAGNQALIARIEAANSVEEMERLFIGIVEKS